MSGGKRAAVSVGWGGMSGVCGSWESNLRLKLEASFQVVGI